MEQYLKLFKNQAEYESATEKPPVSHIVEEINVIMPVSFDKQYLTIEAITGGSIKMTWYSGNTSCSLDDGKTWQSMADEVVFNLEAGQKMLCKNSADPGGGGIGALSGTCDVKIYGNIMSMAYGDDFKGKDSLAGKEYAFRNLFTFIHDKTLSIENVILPATTLSKGCYYALFNSMKRIRKAPKLPATKTEEECYYSMFYNCTSLTEAPELPATELEKWCYQDMFNKCYSLTTTAPMTINVCSTQSCSGMYSNCTQLVDASNVTINYGGSSSYDAYCGYRGMFMGCSRLTKAPVLAAMTVKGDQCYSQMFQDCTSLTEAPELPATSLGGEAYSYMFMGCTALEIAPELAAPAPGSYSYYEMFYDCTKLKYIKMTATNVSARNCLQYWVHNVASTGTFVKKSSTSIPSGENGIPNGWTVQNI